MIQVKEMMQDNDLKNSKSKDKGSKSRSQSMDEQSHYKQDKTTTRQSINVKRYIFNVIGGTEEFKERDLNIGGDCIDYDETFAPVARIEAIHLFLAYAANKDFTVFQMDVKTGLSIGILKGEVSLSTLQVLSANNIQICDKLVCWSSKKQNCVSISTAESEYVAVSGCCAQVLWMRTQLTDYGFFYDKVPIYCDSKSAIAISCNPVQHTRTKHIDVRYHFIKDHVEKGTIELYFVGTEYQLADLFTKSLPEARFKFLVEKLGMMSRET
ncbi:retrovirus-related pol polyprotein from transposon TNT 1-94 [Tanacetum coccineum]